jgi:hypothetical protein
MRFAALALMAGLSACSLTPNGRECYSDSQCGGGDGDDSCARSGECIARSGIQDVTVKWTVSGAPATASACVAHPQLFLQFHGADYGDTLRIAPVSCRDGSYVVDKLPKRYVQVELGVDGSTGELSTIDVATGQAQLELFP